MMRGAAQLLDGPVRKIAILRALFLGDLLCATPALRALRARFPGAEIVLIGLPWASELVARLPAIDRLIPFPGWAGIAEVPFNAARTAAFLEGARGEGFDLALQMHGSGQISNGFVAALGAWATLGYRAGPDDPLTLALPWDPDEHETTRWTRLVAQLGAEADSTRLDLPIGPADTARADGLLDPSRLPPSAFRPLVGLHPGAKDAARRWPVERFAALADRLAERYGARIVLTGAEGERELTAAVRRAMRAPALDLAGRTDLGAFAAVIARLDLLVTNDTGASHVAAATGTRSVVLFGPTRPGGWAPLDRARHTAFDARALVPPGTDPVEALRGLPLEPVLAACAAALESSQYPVVSSQLLVTSTAVASERTTRPTPLTTDY